MPVKLEPGMKLGSDELLSQLNTYIAIAGIVQTWKTRGADGQDYVLRIFTAYQTGRNGTWMTLVYPYKSREYAAGFFAQIREKNVDPILALPPIPGFAPWLESVVVTPDEDTLLFVLRRRFYPERLIDCFRSDVETLPLAALLKVFHHLAQTFDALQARLPALDFDLSPGDFFLQNDLPIVTDCGISSTINLLDDEMLVPTRSRTDPERHIPLSASYPSLYSTPRHQTRSPWKAKIKRTDAQFALAALYVYFRTRYQVFEDPTAPMPQIDFSQTDKSLRMEQSMARIKTALQLSDAVQQYEEHGTLLLPMLSHEAERAIVGRALSRDDSARFASCEAFIDALAKLG